MPTSNHIALNGLALRQGKVPHIEDGHLNAARCVMPCRCVYKKIIDNYRISNNIKHYTAVDSKICCLMIWYYCSSWMYHISAISYSILIQWWFLMDLSYLSTGTRGGGPGLPCPSRCPSFRHPDQLQTPDPIEALGLKFDLRLIPRSIPKYK